jgi:glutamyl-tRNA synthetase
MAAQDTGDRRGRRVAPRGDVEASGQSATAVSRGRAPAATFAAMMEGKDGIRVRFAPSPTGYLHVGGARTALFNWLVARRAGGVFILRIEDTDRARSSDAMTQAIVEGLLWLGLDWDEGPLHQADGIERHRRDAARLLESGGAYRCFCTQEELEGRRSAAEAAGGAYRYDRRCLGIAAQEAEARAAAGEPFTLRCRVPDEPIEWHDAVHGPIRFEADAIDDFIILRSDRTPIYNLAVVSDDIEMHVTHVIRGDDHISNTPKQIVLYHAFGAPLPVFAHVPMILGPDGKRLSKRHGATAVGEYQKEGILPGAMVNFLALLGWNPGDEQEVFDRDELVQRFSLEGINHKSAVFDAQKLEWMNAQHINRLPAASLEPMVLDAFERAGLIDLQHTPDRAWLLELIELLKPRARRLTDFAAHAVPYLRDRVEYDEVAVAKHWKDDATADRLAALRARLEGVAEWRPEPLETELRALANELGTSAGKLIHPLRVALTGAAVSPGIFEVMTVMRRERVLQRLDEAVARLSSR